MGWGRIDDEFDEHPKVLAILDEHEPLEAGAAVGLWLMTFTYAQRNTRKRGKTPGLIPAGLPRRYLGPAARQLAEILVKHRLWDITDGGWIIHDFAEYLPSEKTREERAAAGRKGAAARWHKGDSDKAEASQTDSTLPSPDSNLPSGDGKPMATDGNPVANDGSRTPARRDPIPTPIPITQEQGQTLFPLAATPEGGEPATAKPGKLPDAHRFDEFWAAYPHKRDKDDGRKAWAKVVRESQRPNTDVALDDVIAAAGFYRHSREFVNGYPKHPSRFLNSGAWRDFVAGPPVDHPPAPVGGFDAKAARFADMRDQMRNGNGALSLIRPDPPAITGGPHA